MNTTTTVPKISEELREKIRSFLSYNLYGCDQGRLFFRRIANTTPVNPKFTKVLYPNHIGENITSLNGITKKVFEKNIQTDCSTFYGFTTQNAIRDEPFEFQDTQIYFHSNDYTELNNICKITFENGNLPITPIAGDLICIFMSNNTITRHTTNRFRNINQKPKADKWFIASDQFLRAWTAILYDWNESFDCLIPKNTPIENKDEILYKKFFSGNQLMTNSLLKYKLALEDNNLPPMSDQELEEKYWHYRTEIESKKWVDIYACLVLIARYGELPCSFNVPNNKDNGPKRLKWNLPTNFVSNLFKKLNISNLEGLPCELSELDKIANESLVLPKTKSAADEFIDSLLKKVNLEVTTTTKQISDIFPLQDKVSIKDLNVNTYNKNEISVSFTIELKSINKFIDIQSVEPSVEPPKKKFKPLDILLELDWAYGEL
jgi:hypothetical protein